MYLVAGRARLRPFLLFLSIYIYFLLFKHTLHSYTNSVESILDFKSPFNRFTAKPSPRRSLLHRSTLNSKLILGGGKEKSKLFAQNSCICALFVVPLSAKRWLISHFIANI